MTGVELLIIGSILFALWCLIIPCLTTVIYWNLIKSEKRSTGYMKVFVIVIILSLFFVVRATNMVQTIQPICAGAGDPEMMICAGTGVTPISQANAMIRGRLVADLIRNLGIPIVASLILAGISLGIHYWRRAIASELWKEEL